MKYMITYTMLTTSYSCNVWARASWKFFFF